MWHIYIHHGILCSHKKQLVCALCRNMDEPRNHHSQQTDTRTENQTLHVFTHRRVMNNENTWAQGKEQHSLGWVGGVEGKEGWDSWRVGRWRQQTIMAGCRMCTCTPEPKVQLKKKHTKKNKKKCKTCWTHPCNPSTLRGQGRQIT